MKKVLILEDEVSIRSFVVINLKRAGYDVVEAGTGEEALELLTIAALSASDLSALGDGWQVLTQKGETVYVCRLARRAVALGITTDAIRTQFHFIQNDWKTGDVTTS